MRRPRGWGYSRRYVTSYRNFRSILGRLRSVHSSLARLDRPYGGHRVRAMAAIRTAAGRLGGSSRLRAGLGGRAIARNGAPAIRPISQAASDARMRGAARTLRRIDGQVAWLASAPRHYAGLGAIRRAESELKLAMRAR